MYSVSLISSGRVSFCLAALDCGVEGFPFAEPLACDFSVLAIAGSDLLLGVDTESLLISSSDAVRDSVVSLRDVTCLVNLFDSLSLVSRLERCVGMMVEWTIFVCILDDSLQCDPFS